MDVLPIMHAKLRRGYSWREILLEETERNREKTGKLANQATHGRNGRILPRIARMGTDATVGICKPEIETRNPEPEYLAHETHEINEMKKKLYREGARIGANQTRN